MANPCRIQSPEKFLHDCCISYMLYAESPYVLFGFQINSSRSSFCYMQDPEIMLCVVWWLNIIDDCLGCVGFFRGSVYFGLLALFSGISV